MHCEIFFNENMIKTFFEEENTIDVQRDMEKMGICHHLWLQRIGNGSYMKLSAPYVLMDEEKRVFLQTIKKLKTPTNYVRVLQHKVQKDGKLRGLKSHDYHILMQHILPLCFHTLMQKEVKMSLINLS
jgi:hypothetical protein